MKQIKVSDLERKQLAEWAARAQEWTEKMNGWIDENGNFIDKHFWEPHVNSTQAMELQKKFNVDVLHNEDCVQAWACTDSKGNIIKNPIDCFAEIGRDEIAITRAAIASVYGETVTVEDE